MNKYFSAALFFFSIISFFSCGNLFEHGKKERYLKTITISQYQGDELLGTTICSFDSAGKKISETLKAESFKFPAVENYIYNGEGFLNEIRENDSTARSRTFFHYRDTLKISEECFSDYERAADSIRNFFSMTEDELSKENFSPETKYFYNDEGKLIASEEDGLDEGGAATLKTEYFYSDNGKKRKNITTVLTGAQKGTKTEEIDYEYSADEKTMTESHNYSGKDAYELTIIYYYNDAGVLLRKEFKNEKGVFQKHFYKYEYYNE